MWHLLVCGIAGVGTAWSLFQAAVLCREWWRLLALRSLIASSAPDQAIPTRFCDASTTAGGNRRPVSWGAERVRELCALRHGGLAAVVAVSRLDQGRAGRSLAIIRALAGGGLLLAAVNTISILSTASLPAPAARALPSIQLVVRSAAPGWLGVLWLLLLTLLLGALWKAFLAELERFTLLELAPRLLVTDQTATAERLADRLDECSRRLQAAVEPLPSCLERFTTGLRGSIDAFAPRLDNASHNLLHCVEEMRQASGDLKEGTDRLAESWAGIAPTYAQMEQLASQVAGSQAGQQERLSEIAAGLHGITESLTTVVASANASQEAVARAIGALTGAASGIESSVGRFQGSLDRLAGELVPGGTAEGVTLRRLAEQQQQFINLLDHRLARVDRRPAERR